MPSSCRFAAKRSIASGACAVARHMRGLCVNTCTQSPPIAAMRSIAVSIPPDDDMCAPNSTAAYDREASSVRVRMAPSPTGFLHIRGVRTFLFNWFCGPRRGAACLLSCENTDRSREVAESVEQIQRSLTWLGIDWDGPVTFQLDVMDECREAARRLVDQGKAYEDEGAIRIRMPNEGTTGWDDAVKGWIKFPNEQLEDVVLVRSDGRPTYNFASPFEDAKDRITHV